MKLLLWMISAITARNLAAKVPEAPHRLGDPARTSHNNKINSAAGPGLPRLAPCAIIASDVDITASDNDAYALRTVSLLQNWNHNIHLVVKESNTLKNVDMMKNIAQMRNIQIHFPVVNLMIVEALGQGTLSRICSPMAFFVFIGKFPIPTVPNIAKHGIYIPMINRTHVGSIHSFGEAHMKKWLGYHQIWLPKWNLQLPYNRYIQRIVEDVMQRKTYIAWPLINSVVIPEDARQQQSAFLNRTLTLVIYGLADDHFKAIFHRIPNISTPLPVPKKTGARYAAVIYEGRIHFALKAICHNVMSALVPSEEWELHVLHSNNNDRFVKSLFPESSTGVYYHNVDSKEISLSNYNHLMTGIDFWKTFKSFERVLIFQTDSFFLKPLNYDHLAYDYIGAPWCLMRNPFALQNFKLGRIKADKNMISVGNGGFSIRNPAAMINCLTEYEPAEGCGPLDQPEDMFFVICMTALNMSVAPPHVAGTFSLEQTPCGSNFEHNRDAVVNLNTTALHATWIHSLFRPGEFDKIMDRYEAMRP